MMSTAQAHRTANGAAPKGLTDNGATPAARPDRFCVVVDEAAESRSLLSGELHQLGLETVALRSGSELSEVIADRTPDLVFVDVAGAAADALGTMLALKQVAYPGIVQLMGQGDKGIVKYFSELGQHFSLSMLPILQKPFQLRTIRNIIREHNLDGPPISPPQISLREALDSNWVEFWYQPKIDFATRRAVGAESFARIQHPRLGVLGPQAFMQDADDDSLRELASRAIIGALQLGSRFGQLGLTVRIAANISLDGLAKLPIYEIVAKHRSSSDRWAGLILDVTEQQLYRNSSFLKSIAPSLDAIGVQFALDDFGRGNCSLSDLKNIRFAEIKIDRHFTRNCAADAGNASICKTVVAMAQNFGSVPVAIGVENAAEAQALKQMGCSLGQGFYFSAPLPEAQFFSLICAKTEATATARAS